MATSYQVSLQFKLAGLDKIRELEQKLKGATDESKKTGDALEKAGQRGTAGFGALKAAIAGLGLGALAAGIIKTTSSFEQLELSLTAFTGSTQQATAAFEAFKYIAVESPFDTMQVAAAGKTLLSFGASANEAADMTRRLSMVAGATGADLGLMAVNLGQIRTVGRATTMDLKQMAMQGIPIYQELGKVMYGTADAAAKVQQDISDGKVSYEQVQKALQNLTKAGSAYEKQAKAQLNSLQGLWATLQSAVQEAGNAIGKAFGNEIRSAIGQAIGYVEVFAGWLGKNAAAMVAVAKATMGIIRTIAPLAAGIWIVVKAYQAWKAATTAVGIAQAFVLGLTGPAGWAAIGAGVTAVAGVTLMLNGALAGAGKEIERLKGEAGAAGDKWTGLLNSLNGADEPLKEAAQSQEDFKAAVDASKQAYQLLADEVDRTAASAQLVYDKEAAAVSLKQALAGLEKDQLDYAYDQAKTAQERLDIAVKLFQNAVKMAELEYEAQRASNAAAGRDIANQIKKNELKYKEIEAERALTAARGEDVSKYDQALGAQWEAIDLAKDQLKTAKEIEIINNGVAAAQLQQKILSAQIALSTKLQSTEIGIAKQRADDMARSYGNAAIQATNAANAIAAANRAAAGSKANAPVPTGSMSISAGGQSVNQKFYADGGYVTGRTNAVIGEGGEPEYVIPASKMDQAMARYAGGARGNAVLSGNPQVNVNYSGSVVSMGGNDYISKGDVPGLLSSAVSQTLRTLQRSPDARRSAGIR